MKPIRIQLSRKKGWRMPPNTVKVCRPSKWGNPFAVDEFGTLWAVHYYRAMLTDESCKTIAQSEKASTALAKYRERIGEHPGLQHITAADVRNQLRGRNLACFCSLDRPCHADVLLEIANG
jgi:hypothetical protein